jgi:hypothetical protein
VPIFLLWSEQPIHAEQQARVKITARVRIERLKGRRRLRSAPLSQSQEAGLRPATTPDARNRFLLFLALR